MMLFRLLEGLKYPDGSYVLTRRQASAVQDALESAGLYGGIDSTDSEG